MIKAILNYVTDLGVSVYGLQHGWNLIYEHMPPHIPAIRKMHPGIGIHMSTLSAAYAALTRFKPDTLRGLV